MEILTHLNRRIKNNLLVTLPLNDIFHYLLSSQGNVLGTVWITVSFTTIELKLAYQVFQKAIYCLVRKIKT